MFPIRDHNPSGSPPVLTLLLIGANLLAFLATHALQTDRGAVVQVMTWGLIPARIAAGQGYETLLTHMFLHGSWAHLLGNMLFLWIFGDNMEDRLGRLGFLAFYLAAGLAAAAAQGLADPGSTIPMVGASGAIAGVLGGYLWLFPRARIDVLFFFVIIFRILPLPAWLVLSAWFAIQLAAGAATPADAGGVAYWAHVGGFAAGLGLAVLFFRRPRLGEDRLSPTRVPRVPRRRRGP